MKYYKIYSPNDYQTNTNINIIYCIHFYDVTATIQIKRINLLNYLFFWISINISQAIMY